MEPLLISEDIRIPAAALRLKALRASGPGGQNVNKVASKVEIRLDPARIEGLDEGARARLLHQIRNRLDADGQWIVTSERSRDQSANIEDARGKIVQAIQKALPPPVPRRPTRPTKGSQERRLTAKKRAGQLKRDRRGCLD